jgi:deoxyribodipyrimidine photo-lyase
VVDPLAAARTARDQLWALRRDPGHAQTAAAIVRRHASRADGTGRFVSDRTPRSGPAADSRQLSLDL